MARQQHQYRSASLDIIRQFPVLPPLPFNLLPHQASRRRRRAVPGAHPLPPSLLVFESLKLLEPTPTPGQLFYLHDSPALPPYQPNTKVRLVRCRPAQFPVELTVQLLCVRRRFTANFWLILEATEECWGERVTREVKPKGCGSSFGGQVKQIHSIKPAYGGQVEFR